MDTWEEIFAKSTTPLTQEYIREVFKRSVTQVGENWNDIRSQFDDLIADTVKTSTSKIVESVATVKDEISTLLQDNATLPASELRDKLKEKFTMYRESRINTIARTTATYTTGASQKEAWTGLDIESVWFSSRRNSRPAHAAADGQRQDKDGYFTVGGERMQWPAGGSNASNNVNCQCYLRPRPKG